MIPSGVQRYIFRHRRVLSASLGDSTPTPFKLLVSFALTLPVRLRCLLMLLPAMLAGPSFGEAGRDTSLRGNLIIVGGGDTPAHVQERFIALAGGPGKARIALFPMASTAFDEEAREVMADFRKLNADPHLINIERKDAGLEATLKLLEGFSGYWFLGGDQNRLAATLIGTGALDVIERRYQEGAVVGGTSAGAAVMTSEMLTGRSKADGAGLPAIARGAIDVGKGFGFLPGAIVDQHFLKRARYNRLLSAVLDQPQLIGVGIDEETALQVRPDGRWEVLGNSYVKVIDARRSRLTHDRKSIAAAANIRLHLLPRGSVFDPKRGEATLPGG